MLSQSAKLKSLVNSSRVLGLSRKLSTALDLSGIFPPIPTPFQENEDINWDQLDKNLLKWNSIPFKGYVVQGSNGEYISLSHQEKVDIVKFVAEKVGNGKLILAGSGCEGTRETIKLTNEMADVGADAALVVTPSFFKNRMNASAMIKHYTKVADSSNIPVILYNVPSNTGIELPLDATIELSKHPNIIGLKDSSGNITNIGHIVNETRGEQFQILAGSASFLMAALNIGAVGGVCALANILGQECCDLVELVNRGDMKAAKELQLKLIDPNQAVTRKYNVPALKYAMGLFGYYGGPCRSPLGDLTEKEAADIEHSFAKEFL